MLSKRGKYCIDKLNDVIIRWSLTYIRRKEQCDRRNVNMATDVNIPKIHEIFSYNIVPRGKLYGSAKNFKLRVHVKYLQEYYTVTDLTSSTTVTKLKEKLEAITGIPT